MRSIVTTLGELIGFGAITTGAWLITPAAGWIVGGGALVLVSYLAGGER